jgi:hypothetical protein
MKAANKVYTALRAMAANVPYRDIEIDIEELKKVGGGDFIIGIRKLGTKSFIYRKPSKDWSIEFAAVMDIWPETEWYAGSVNEGWIIALSDRDVPRMLKDWDLSRPWSSSFRKRVVNGCLGVTNKNTEG